jgi:hypothetical protein
LKLPTALNRFTIFSQDGRQASCKIPPPPPIAVVHGTLEKELFCLYKMFSITQSKLFCQADSANPYRVVTRHVPIQRIGKANKRRSLNEIEKMRPAPAIGRPEFFNRDDDVRHALQKGRPFMFTPTGFCRKPDLPNGAGFPQVVDVPPRVYGDPTMVLQTGMEAAGAECASDISVIAGFESMAPGFADPDAPIPL